ncbi:GerW family sporulation protein [Lederbergia citri]|uniref:GerW family sporulation protein n=1 Tax=Lederbergia citri TaxID=2833580 RepID=A0A942YI32_9BACI|nr:GerW family sporulation protein [Lederbergia citri]MBS4195006.1 GerW family sporulation protein [Lederbergia citri]
MDEHPIQGVMSTAMENLKEMIDVNTIIGDPVETPDGGVILTVSKVGFGFAMGGSEFKSGGSSDGGGSSSEDEGGQSSYLPFGGGSGGGVSITPIAFLIVNKHGVNMLHLEQNTHLLEKMIDLAPTAFEKIQKMTSNFSNKKHQQQGHSENKESLDFDL